MAIIYLDNNATTQVAPEVIEVMTPYFGTYYGNPSSMHSFGGNVSRAVLEAREHIAALINAHVEEILITSCGSESDNTALFSALKSQPNKKHLVTTKVEHPAVLNVARHYENSGYTVTYLSVDFKGRIDLDEYKDALRNDTALVSIMYANNEVGNIYPIEKMAHMAKERGIAFHTDAVQAVGKIAIDVQKIPVDFLALSGHKLHAPKGIGALYVRKGARLRPLILGGHQEHGRRAGTENVPYIIGFGKAAELAYTHLQKDAQHISALRDTLEQGLLARIADCVVNGDTDQRLTNTSNISFKYIEGEAILLMLDRCGICASSGSACTSGTLEPSHVLRAMGVPFTYAHGAIRLSLSRYTTEQDIQHTLATLPTVVSKLRALSPFTDA